MRARRLLGWPRLGVSEAHKGPLAFPTPFPASPVRDISHLKLNEDFYKG